MTKDPKRWQEVIIDSPFAKLTKQDVYDYYQRSDIRNKILDAVRAPGTEETILRQSFSPGRTILRRKDHQGDLIDLRKSKDFNTWAKLRMTEVHPVFGKQTNILLADVDPGENVPWKKTKSIADTIAKTMSGAEGVKDVQVQFSGDRGFYIKGIMSEKIDINDARNKVKDLMDGLVQRPDVTLEKAKVDQIRIDTTPLKNRGSVKAPYSLSAVTGLVAAPVTLKDLLGVQRADFKIDKIKTAAKKKEFAPGIPVARTISKIPSIKNKAWTLAVQLHDAKKAGKHYDIRLVDPKTEKAHSFAVPKARLPRASDRMLLAIQQPTHTSSYALGFEGTIPAGTYGAGKVTMPIKEPINVIKANADRVDFERKNGQRFVLFRTKGNNWGFKRKKA